jgi:tetratricopeptide (TPR) repeat protein
MQQAMIRDEAGEARVIPVILRPVDWHSAPFGRLQALPKDGRPVTSWPNRDEAYRDIVRGIRVVAEETVPPESSMIEATIAQVRALTQSGQYVEAVRVARTLEDATRRSEALRDVALLLAQASHLEQSFELARSIEDTATRARALVELAPYLPAELLSEALAAARSIKDTATRARALVELAPYLPAELLPEALAAARSIEDATRRSEALRDVASSLAQAGWQEEALYAAQDAVDIDRQLAEARPDTFSPELAGSLNNLAGLYRAHGRYRDALQYYHEALSITREADDRAGLVTSLNNIGEVHRYLGQPQEALRYYEQALSITREAGDRAGESVTRSSMAMVYRAQGKLAEAVEALHQVVELDEQVQHPDLESHWALLRQVEQEGRESLK